MHKSFLGSFLFAFAIGLLFQVANAGAYVNDANIYQPPNYSTFQPPAVGGSYTEPVFGTSIKRISNALATPNLDSGGNLIFITDEYSTMSPFNMDNSKILLVHQSYYALYDGSGNFLKALPFEINTTSEPRWSHTDPNVLYYHYINQLKQYNVSTGATAVVHIFSEYSSITGKGESDISYDGNHFVLVGDNRFVFVYEISTNTKGPAFDTGGRGFDSVYITPNNNVTISWLQAGTNRYNGIELFDRNMIFLRQVAHVGGHMDVTLDTDGSEVLVWTNSNDAQPIPNCQNGFVKIKLATGQQTCLLQLDWSLAVHVSGTGNNGWVFVETYNPSDINPGSSSWVAYTNEILQIKLDGTEVRRLLHHRSRPFNSYNYQPHVSVSRDGTRFLYNGNYGLQATLGYTSEYSDVYLAVVSSTTATSNEGSTTTTSGSTSGSTSTSTGESATTTSSGTTTSGSTTTSSGTTSESASTTATMRTQGNSSALSYSGSWYTVSQASFSSGSAVEALDAGSKATFSFTGAGVRWIGYRDEWSGKANVYLDGQFQITVDTYASPSQAQTVIWSASGLSAASHTLTIEVSGDHSVSSAGSWVWIDAFDVDPTTTTPTTSISGTTSSASTTTENASNTTTTTDATTPASTSSSTGSGGGDIAFNYYLPHLALGAGWQTTLTYINYSTQSVTCTTTFLSDTGGPLAVPFGGAAASSRTDTLGPGQSIHTESTANLSAPQVTGWAQVGCSAPMKVSLLFRFYQGGPQGETSVNATTTPATRFVTFANKNTGVAYANPSTQTAEITFTAISSTGVKLASKSLSVLPGGHGAANVGAFLGVSDFTGSIQIVSSVPIISLSLNAEAFPVISSLPPGDLDGSTGLF